MGTYFKPPTIYVKPFAWNQSEIVASLVNKLKKEQSKNTDVTKTSSPIALIAHGYGDDDSENDDENHKNSNDMDAQVSNLMDDIKSNRTKSRKGKSHAEQKSRKRKIEMRVKSQKQAQESLCHTLPPAASIFHESEYVTDEEEQLDHDDLDQEKYTNTNRQTIESEDMPLVKCAENRVNDDMVQSRPNKYIKVEPNETRRKNFSDITIGPTYKKSIDNIAEILCDKLESLEVHSIQISPLKLLAIQIETLFEAWHNGALSAAYMQKFLAKMQGEMSQLESHELAPPGWRVIWNRYSG